MIVHQCRLPWGNYWLSFPWHAVASFLRLKWLSCNLFQKEILFMLQSDKSVCFFEFCAYLITFIEYLALLLLFCFESKISRSLHWQNLCATFSYSSDLKIQFVLKTKGGKMQCKILISCGQFRNETVSLKNF